MKQDLEMKKMMDEVKIMNELLQKIESGIQKQSFARLLDLKLETAESGQVSISCRKREDLLQQNGLIHGGVIAAVAEAASGYAALTLLPKGYSVMAVEYKINFLRPASGDKIIATAKVVKNGRKLIVIDVEVYDEQKEKLIAKMMVTTIPAADSI